MKLLYQTHSPYARKTLVAAHEMGLMDRLEVVHHETSPLQRNEEIFALNPLGKVPVLVIDNACALFDSNVICEYLDGLHYGRKWIPSKTGPHFAALQMQALAQGIADAGILARWEAVRRPPALRWSEMHDGQVRKIIAACDFLECKTDADKQPDIGDIALATALSWIEFRDVYSFRNGRPRLTSWYDTFCDRPSMRATALAGDTQD